MEIDILASYKFYFIRVHNDLVKDPSYIHHFTKSLKNYKMNGRTILFLTALLLQITQKAELSKLNNDNHNIVNIKITLFGYCLFTYILNYLPICPPTSSLLAPQLRDLKG